MSSTNSIIPYIGATIQDLQETIGITQFPSETSWYQVLGGLIVQGGLVEVGDGATLAVEFPAPYETQVLGVFTQVSGGTANTAHLTGVTTAGFNLVNGVGARSYYWWSVGV